MERMEKKASIAGKREKYYLCGVRVVARCKSDSDAGGTTALQVVVKDRKSL